jgi:DNA polymerase III alpha subunit
MAAIEQVLDNRPFMNAEDLLFREGISYSKLNKKAFDALCRGGALDNIVDDRFTGRKHFWSACIVERPKNLKKFAENVELYKPEGDFSEEEIIQFKTDLTGVFPINLVISTETIESYTKNTYHQSQSLTKSCRFAGLFRAEIIARKTKNGKVYWIVNVIDSNNEQTKIRCWGVKPEKDRIHLNRPYLARLNYDANWGFQLMLLVKHLNY